MNRNLTLPEHGMVIVLLLIGVLLTYMLTGCGTARQHFYIGQAADFASTCYGLDVAGDFAEGNLFSGSTEEVLLLKAVAIAIIEWIAHIDPARAKTYYALGAVFGYGAAVWNINVMTGNRAK